MKKISEEYQKQFVASNKQFYNESVRNTISPSVKLHEGIKEPHSSAATCLNVLGYLNLHQEDIPTFCQHFGLEVEEVIPFPTGVNVDGEIYDDTGPIVFEWIGPKDSPINEGCRGGRGAYRTSIDAFFLAKIGGKITQILVEWKFTEPPGEICRFAGLSGTERLQRYSGVLKRRQRRRNFPFRFEECSYL